jgi:hypothetical protein
VSDETRPPISICPYGPPGTGKTTLIGTMCEVIAPIIAVDADCKMRTMSNLVPYISDGRLIVKEIKSKLVEETLRDRATSSQSYKRQDKNAPPFVTMGPPKKQPKGYLEICEVIEELDSEIAKTGARAVAFDPITEAYSHMYRLVSFITQHGTIEESAWSILLMNAEELISAIFRLPVEFIIVTAHDRSVYSEAGSLTGVFPEVPGQMRGKFLKYFTEAYHMEPQWVNGETIYMMRTAATPYVQARTSRVLKPLEPADMRVIFDPLYRAEYYKEGR